MSQNYQHQAIQRQQSPTYTIESLSHSSELGNSALLELCGLHYPTYKPVAPTAGIDASGEYAYRILDWMSEPTLAIQKRQSVEKLAKDWALPFSSSDVQYAELHGIPVIELRWKAAWGKLPEDLSIPADLAPIDASMAITFVHSMPGWEALTNEERQPVETLLELSTNPVSQSARHRLLNESFASKSTLEQAEFLRSLGTNQTSLPSITQAFAGADKAAIHPRDPSKPLESSSYRGDNPTAGGNFRAYAFGNSKHYIRIQPPRKEAPDLVYHRVDDIVEALSRLPEARRNVIQEVIMQDKLDPNDIELEKRYSDSSLFSYMTPDSASSIYIYPITKSEAEEHQIEAQENLIGAIDHAAGRIWLDQAWNDKKMDAWRAAMKADVICVSRHAALATPENCTEDILQTIRIYRNAQNDKATHDNYWKLVPHRFALLKQELG